MGEVTILRLDRLPFTDEHCAVLWDFFFHLMDEYGEEGGAQRLMATVYSPAGFRVWLRDHGGAALPR